MTVTITLNGTTTLDESGSLQDATATPSAPGDANDNDVSLSRLQSHVSAFYNRLLRTGTDQLESWPCPTSTLAWLTYGSTAVDVPLLLFDVHLLA